MEALSPGREVQSLNREIGSRSIMPCIRTATESNDPAFDCDDAKSTTTQATSGAYTPQTCVKHYRA